MPEFNDWRDRVVDTVIEDRRASRRTTGIVQPASFVAIINRAARARDMTMGAFMRRSAIAVACHDLGLDWSEIMAEEPAIRNYNRSAASVTFTGGSGHGPWQIPRMFE